MSLIQWWNKWVMAKFTCYFFRFKQVPSYFNGNQRRALLAAARVSGLDVVKLLNDGTAATHAYYHCREKELPPKEARPRFALFFDFGHTSMQASVASLRKGEIKVLACCSRT
jgi:molecular chaperone DnaK (HSP70)